MSAARATWGIAGIALVGQAALLLPVPLVWKAGAMVLLAALIGWLIVELALGRGDAAGRGMPTRFEHALFAVGAGYVVLALVVLLLSYVPGPLASWPMYAVVDVLLVGLLLGARWKGVLRSGDPGARATDAALIGRPTGIDEDAARMGRRVGEDEDAALVGRSTGQQIFQRKGREGRKEGETRAGDVEPAASRGTEGGSAVARPGMPGSFGGWMWVGLALVLGIGAFFRLANLGYAEFHGDEARAVLRGAAVIQGYDDVLMLHKKGPVEILLPTAVFALAGRIDEAAARLPFALAGVAALAAIFWVGRQAVGALGGWAAAMLLALDGFYIGFGRIVQYQSVVLLMSALVVGVLLRLWRRPAAFMPYLTLAATFFAVGLWSHYEAIFVLPPALWLWIAIWRKAGGNRRDLVRASGVAAAVGGALIALFYLPFVLHPQFAATYTYLIERRIGLGAPGPESGAPYNNLADFFVRATTYSSTYAIVLLIALAALALALLYRRAIPRWGWAAGALWIAGAAAFAWNPTWLAVGGVDWAVLFFGLALLLAWIAPSLPVAERGLWLWLGLPLIFELFLTEKPRTHVYIFFTPLALLAGLTVARGWLWLRGRVSRGAMQGAGAAVAAACVLLFGVYEYWMFVHTRVEILRTWQENWPRGYWTVYDTLDNRALFGFPLANGWKAVGALYGEGEIAGAYATNEVEFWTPTWYTRGQLRCEDKAAWFFEIANPQPDPAGYQRALDEYVGKSYRPWGVVEIFDQPRLVLHARGEEAFEVRHLRLGEYAPAFDAGATPDLPLGYPVVEPPIAHRLDANLGGLITLEGYDLAYDAPLRAGDTFRLTLYWRARQEIAESYKVFNQSYYGDGVMVAQQDGYPVCGARGTWLWSPGEQVVDVHEVQVRPDAPDGLYPLYTGLYIEETFERLPVLDEAGAPVGDQVHITDIRIGAEP